MKVSMRIGVLLLAVVVFFWVNIGNITSALKGGGWYETPHYEDGKPIVGDTDLEEDSDPVGAWSSVFSKKIKWIITLPQPENYTTSLWYTMSLIQVAINWLLWILSFVALIYMLYCGFLIFSSWSDDKNAWKWKKWIMTAAIALAGIWLSWLVVSVMIWFINKIAWS